MGKRTKLSDRDFKSTAVRVQAKIAQPQTIPNSVHARIVYFGLIATIYLLLYIHSLPVLS